MKESDKKVFHVHLVSDATGETINSIARACLVQFAHVKIKEHFWSLIRTKRQLDLVSEGLRHWPGLVLYTFVDSSLNEGLSKQCLKLGLPSLSILDPVLAAMTSFFGQEYTTDPGKQHVLDEEYFARIDAMEYAISYDDGHQTDKIEKADVIILGVSRTSKTPTCIYLSHRGIKAANVPIVPGLPLNVDFSKLKNTLIVGLTREPEALVQTRRTRLNILKQEGETSYTDLEAVSEEVREARRFFARMGFPVIDVTRRSIEETAAEIMMMLSKRKIEKALQKAEEEKKDCPI